jgi:hypothetical protein
MAWGGGAATPMAVLGRGTADPGRGWADPGRAVLPPLVEARGDKADAIVVVAPSADPGRRLLAGGCDHAQHI